VNSETTSLGAAAAREQQPKAVSTIAGKSIWKHSRGLRYEGTPFESSVVQPYGDSMEFNFGPFLGAMDFVFVDASHTYDDVLNHSRMALRLLRNGRGTVAWHGYAARRDGVVRAVDKLYATEPNFAGMRHIDGTELAYARGGCIEGGHECE
jgi:hypothetical protein